MILGLPLWCVVVGRQTTITERLQQAAVAQLMCVCEDEALA